MDIRIVLGEYCCKCGWVWPENYLMAGIHTKCPNQDCGHEICGLCGCITGILGQDEPIKEPASTWPITPTTGEPHA